MEYVPKAINNHSEPIPTYIPSSVPNQTSNDEYEPSPVFSKEDVIENPIDVDLNADDISGLLTELSSEQITNNENHTVNVPNDSEQTIDLKGSQHHKSKENSHRSLSSSSSSSRHRHHSSSSTHKSSHSDRKSSSRSSGSTHKSSHHSSSSSSRKSKHSDRDRDKEKSVHTSSSKSSKESRHKNEHRSKSSSSSSSSSRHHSSSGHSNQKTHNSNNNNKTKDCQNSSVIYETDSEEDDVEAQCRIIFEEFDPSTLECKQDEMPNGSATSTEEDDSTSKVDDVTKKKRVAHENADNQNKPITTIKRHTNHVTNALQV